MLGFKEQARLALMDLPLGVASVAAGCVLRSGVGAPTEQSDTRWPACRELLSGDVRKPAILGMWVEQGRDDREVCGFARPGIVPLTKTRPWVRG